MSINIPLSNRYLALLEPLGEAHPCGRDLEYHPDLLVVQRQTEAREAAQYGDFIAPGAAINWRETEDALLRILDEGRDLRALVLLLRCRVELAGAQGAAEGLGLIAELLERYPQAVHPQHVIDGERAPGVRANALGELISPALLDALRNVLVDAGTATRLSVRDVERSFSAPRPADAIDPESIQRHLQALLARRDEKLVALARAHRAVLAISAFAERDLDSEAPDFYPLQHLLHAYALAESLLPQAPEALLPRLKAVLGRWFGAAEPATAEPPGIEEALPPREALAARRPGSIDQAIVDAELLLERSPVAGPMMAAYPDYAMPTAPATISLAAGPDHAGSREDARALIRAARAWFERCEPSSPVADLLKQAERLIGKPYVDLIDAIPADLLRAWRKQDD